METGKLVVLRFTILTMIMFFVAGCVNQQNLGLTESTKASLHSSIAGFEPSEKGTILGNRCKRNRITTRSNVLVAERTLSEDTHYIEFRYRLSPALATGHMYVVYGRLDENGLPETFKYTGLYPKGSIVGLYAAGLSTLPISANIKPSVLDCNFLPIAAYRRSIDAAQYQKLLAKMAEYRATPPKWAVLRFNCNHYAASLGAVVGLKSPESRTTQPLFTNVYFRQYVQANGDKIRLLGS